MTDDNSKEVQRFLVLLKSQKGKACAALTEQILAASGLYSFGEFLNHANVKSLKGGSEGKWYNALELFAYGTYSDYLQNKVKYPTFNAKQMTKLKQLSIVTLAGKSTTKILIYKDLMTQLDVNTVRELEDMIIECIYNELIVGRLDQRSGLVEISYCRGRDINKDAIGAMKNRLLSWLKHTDELVKLMANQQQQAISLTNLKNKQYDDAQRSIEKTTQALLEKAQIEKVAHSQND